MSQMVSPCSRGQTSVWPLEKGKASRNAKYFASSKTMCEGALLDSILQKMHSSAGAFSEFKAIRFKMLGPRVLRAESPKPLLFD
jgi:hypothetical protein